MYCSNRMLYYNIIMAILNSICFKWWIYTYNNVECSTSYTQYNAVSKNRHNAHFGLRTCWTLIRCVAEGKFVEKKAKKERERRHTHSRTHKNELLVFNSL